MKFFGFLAVPLAVAAFLTFPCPKACAWGREGHETVARLADMNLKPHAKKKIEKYLGGHSIVYVAKWMDEYRGTPTYSFTSSWHTTDLDANQEYRSRENGDAIYGIETALKTLENYKDLSDSVVALNIRYLVHLLGDMHCPSHINYVGKSIGYNVLVEDPSHIYVENSGHALWDMVAIRSFRFMCATEWAAELDKVLSKDDRKAIAQGTPREWLHESAIRCEVQFDLAHSGEKLSTGFSRQAMPLIETQITYAGIRLAHILNSIFK